jgi:hypothetical protein
VLQRATSSGVLANPVALESLLSAATTALTVDDGTDIDHLRTLATRLRGLAADKVRFETIPVRPPTRAEGADSHGQLGTWGSVQIYEPRRLDAFFEPLRGHQREDTSPETIPGTADAPLAAAPDPAAPAPGAPDPATVRVDVYNASGASGLAAEVATQLTGAGFQVGAPKNWPRGVSSVSQVRYGPGSLAAARAVLAVVPDAVLTPDSTLAPAGTGTGTTRVSLVLGSSHVGTSHGGAPAGRQVAGTGTDPAAPPGSAAVTAADLVANCTY